MLPSVALPRSARLVLLGALAAVASPRLADAAPSSTPYPLRSVTIQGQTPSHLRLGGSFAMNTFRIDYANGWDTAIRDVGVEAVGDGYARAWLADDDGSSPVTLRGSWRNMGELANEKHHWVATCHTKKCRIGSFRHDSTSTNVALLAGFAIHNIAGAKKVGRVAIFPEYRTGPNASTTYYAYFDAEGPTRYTVDLELVLVDPAAVQGQYDATASSEKGTGYAEVPVHWNYYGLLALQGFDASFTNGKHHLNRLAVDMVKGNNGVRAVHFADRNSDDPMTAKLWWADLKPLGPKVVKTNKPLPTKKPIGPAPVPKFPLPGG